MDKIWLEHYPEGVPHEIDTTQFANLVDLFDKSVEKYADLPAFQNFGKALTYREVDQLTDQFASYLVNEAGLVKGDRVAIMMPNLLQFPIAMFGALKAGMIVVNTNPLYTDRELKHQLSDSGAKAIVIVENFASTLEKVIDDTQVESVITTQIGDMVGGAKGAIMNLVIKRVKKMVPAFSLPGAVPFKQALEKGAQHSFTKHQAGHHDTAFLQYTGGTTGVSKGAELSHANLLANLLQANAWTAMDLEEGAEIVITALPLYHVFALTANALFALMLGAKNVLITNPRDFPKFIAELQKEPFSFITGVNTLYNAMLNTPGFDKIDFSKLKIALGGGMAVQQSVADEWVKRTGATLLEAYGLTETSPAVSINPVDMPAFNGMIGLPVPSTEVSIRSLENEPLELRAVGELCVRGPQVMTGYWNRPEATAEILDDDGWLHTGDMAFMDERGYIKLVDRIKDMVNVSGFNVYPNELEEVIASHPKVLEVGVIGIPDSDTGETPYAYVVKKEEDLTEEELNEWCKEELTGYKRPSGFAFADELPKSNVGKILRREIRDLHALRHS